MDPVTHALTGAAIKGLGFKRKGSTWVLLFSAIAPDLDYVTRWSIEAFLRYHRGITHSIAAMLVAPLLIAAVASRMKKGFWYFYAISTLGYASHIALDLTNQYGTRVLAPLDWRPLALDLTFILDPYFTLTLVLGLMFAWALPKRAVAVSALTLALLGGMLLAKQHFHDQALEFARATLSHKRIERVTPLPNAFLRWGFLARDADGTAEVGHVDLFLKRAYVDATFPPQSHDPIIDSTRALPIVESFLYYAQAPYAQMVKREGKTYVLWRELNYAYLPGERFTATVLIAEGGKPISKGFKY